MWNLMAPSIGLMSEDSQISQYANLTVSSLGLWYLSDDSDT